MCYLDPVGERLSEEDPRERDVFFLKAGLLYVYIVSPINGS